MRFEYAPPGGSLPVAVDLEGMAPDDHIVQEIARAGSFYESDLLEHLASVGPRGGVYVDVGANIGNHTVYFARFLADRVIAVEANPDVVPVLRTNVERNQPAVVEVVACAAGAATAEGVLVVPPGMEHNVGAWEVHAAGTGGPGGGVRIPIRALDDVLGELLLEDERVSLVKIDVEGMEGAVLRGATRILAAHRPVLVVEMKDDEVLSAVSKLLRPFGYRVTGRFCWTPTYVLHPGDPG